MAQTASVDAQLDSILRIRRSVDAPRPLDVRPPAGLGKADATEWRRVVRLARAARWTALDRDALVVYVVTFARWMEAQRQVDSLGLVVKNSQGMAVANPYLCVAERAQRDMVALARELGLTPAARGTLR